MFNNILKWGVISGLIMIIIFYLSYLIFPLTNAAAYSNSEIMGYLGILIGVVIIYFAISEHFNAKNASQGIWPRILLGFGVAFVAGVIVGLYNVFYTLVIDPTFMADYLAFTISQIPTQSGAEYDQQVALLTQQMQTFDSVGMNFLIMAATVWLIGIPASFICAFTHKQLSR